MIPITMLSGKVAEAMSKPANRDDVLLSREVTWQHEFVPDNLYFWGTSMTAISLDKLADYREMLQVVSIEEA